MTDFALAILTGLALVNTGLLCAINYRQGHLTSVQDSHERRINKIETKLEQKPC